VNQFTLGLSRHVQFFFFVLLLRVESPDIEIDWSRRFCGVACLV
jgi:hypothetical protein